MMPLSQKLGDLTSDERLVMCGCHEVGHHILSDLLERNVQFDYFVTLTPDQAEKHAVSGYYDLSSLAEKYDIPVYIPESYSLDTKQDRTFFEDHKFDLLVQGGWQRLFPEDILKTLNIGAIGGHGSADFLPTGRGRSPLNWSLIEDQERFIHQLFLITPGVDDGDVFDWQSFDINVFDDIRTLYYKIGIATTRMLLRSLPELLEGNIETYPQKGTPSYYPKRTPDDGKITWEDMNVWDVYNFVRAQTCPYPGAFATIQGREHYLWKTQVFDTRLTYPDADYGDVVATFGDDIIVKCRGGLLLIEEYEIK